MSCHIGICFGSLSCLFRRSCFLRLFISWCKLFLSLSAMPPREFYEQLAALGAEYAAIEDENQRLGALLNGGCIAYQWGKGCAASSMPLKPGQAHLDTSWLCCICWETPAVKWRIAWRLLRSITTYNGAWWESQLLRVTVLRGIRGAITGYYGILGQLLRGILEDIISYYGLLRDITG